MRAAVSTFLLALGWLIGPPSAVRAQTPLQVRRGDLAVKIRVSGIIVASGVVQLKSPFDGRVESLGASTGTWVQRGKPLGYLVNKEMALLLDSRGTTETGVLEDRWRSVYRPTPLRCLSDCFVLRVLARDKEWLKRDAVVIEAARKLQAVGHVRAEDADDVKNGQLLEFWPAGDPSRKRRARVADYAGGDLAIDLEPGRSWPPGTPWEGVLTPVAKRGALLVPTAALIEYGGSAYLPVKVSTGMTVGDFTEVTAGVENQRPILALKRVATRPPESPPARDDHAPDYGADPYSP